MAQPKGIVYAIAASSDYLERAIVSAVALRNLNVDLPIVFISDLEVDLQVQRRLSSVNIDWHRVEIPVKFNKNAIMSSRWLKTNIIQYAQFEQTLYLDADILPLAPIDDIWNYLDQSAIAMGKSMDNPTLAESNHVAKSEKDYTLLFYSPQSTQFNSGVILWRNSPEVRNLFLNWYNEWLMFKQYDQLALIRAIGKSKILVSLLPEIYNYSVYKMGDPSNPATLNNTLASEEQIRLLHCFGSSISIANFQAIANKLLFSRSIL